jgi:ABC-2 type transport system permease protein
MITIIRKELQILMTEKGTIFRLVFIPIIFIVLFSSVSGGKSSKAINELVPNFMIMFVFYIMLSMLNGFFKERESGLLARLRSTPMKPLNYLFGVWAANIIAVLIQCTILLGFGHFVYNLNLGDLGAMIPLVIALAISVTGIGLAISFLSAGQNQGVAIIQIITICGPLLSGTFISTDKLPAIAQKVGNLTPQYWAQRAMHSIMVQGSNINNILPNLAVLLAFGILGLIIAKLRFKEFILADAN